MDNIKDKQLYFTELSNKLENNFDFLFEDKNFELDNYLNKKLRVVDNSIRHEYSYDKSFSTKTIMNNITENTVVFFGSSELNPENVPNEHPLGLLNYKDICYRISEILIFQ